MKMIHLQKYVETFMKMIHLQKYTFPIWFTTQVCIIKDIFCNISNKMCFSLFMPDGV